ncbi:Sugar transporter [Lunatimonas lonarensis]|uniref:Sugar transporter n=1 Tax=Lunatimonas lonarensis TaxID=1232681 RepID=R7ZYQ1_9BACT|nr:AraD1 family protein [Lunatimonas lonarensis]EON79184.1 Sugar transporter [Lunatimonas lonarensis]
MKLVQFKKPNGKLQTGMVQGDRIQLLRGEPSLYELVMAHFKSDRTLEQEVHELIEEKWEDYGTLIANNWLEAPISHPDPYRTWVTGTGLTHLGSATSRDTMHQKLKQSDPDELTDSMKMFQMGLKGGKMVDDTPGVQPEWFYKGNGLMVVAPGRPLISPSFALDGGEEPEIAGIYVNRPDGTPFRVGFAIGNEFSDHKMEKINYLYLAHSKLRQSSFGPEILLGELPKHLVGTSRVKEGSNVIWEKEFLTGEANMSHSIRNLEYHHFKYDLFRQAGDVHVHYFGTSVVSFADGIEVRNGQLFEIDIPELGRPLVNPFQQV